MNKLAIYTRMKYGIENDLNTGLCSAYEDAMEELYNIGLDGMETLLKHLPELVPFKPENKEIGEFWFIRGSKGKEIRLNILNEIICNL